MKGCITELDADEPVSAEADFFAMSLDHLCVASFEGYFLRVNPSWTRTLGWSVEELLARPVIDLVHPDDRAMTLAGRRRLHEGTPMGPLLNRYACRDGSYRWFEWRSIADLERRVVYAAARDVTERKQLEDSLRAAREHEAQLERQLLLADRMASVGTLAAGAAHEVNNPLASVMANLALMSEELETLGGIVPAQQLAELRQMAGDALGSAEKIRKVIRGLKTFSRDAVARRAPIDVRQVIELSVSLTANEIQQRAILVKELGPVPVIEGDEAQLGQLFVNLLVNAAQAIPEGHGGRNEIRVVTLTDAEGRAVIEVRDTGTGIPAELTRRIFDPFFTTKGVGVGTGLGLSICHNIVTALGGTIAVTSQVGRGSTFRVVLPAAEELPAPAPPPAPAAAKDGRARVLIVDDEPTVGATLRRVLREHDVTVVTSAPEALAQLDSGQRYDVILSDLMMPEMSGMELFAELEQRHAHAAARVVFISGGAFTAAASRFLDEVPNERLEKPFDTATVRAVIRRYMTRR